MGAESADLSIQFARAHLAKLLTHEDLFRLTLLCVALPIASRSKHPAQVLKNKFGIPWKGTIQETVASWIPEESEFSSTGLQAFREICAAPQFSQTSLSHDEWLPWRQFDGAAFGEPVRVLFATILAKVLSTAAPSSKVKDQETRIHQLAWELTKITLSFSARWFNKCAVGCTPSGGSIKWFLAHSLGKLDLEMERELSNHVEPPRNKRVVNQIFVPTLGL